MSDTINTLIIYDNTGRIYFQGTGVEPPQGLQYLEIAIPTGSYAESIDVSKTPHEAVFKSNEGNTYEVLQRQIDDLNIALASLMGV